MVIGTDELLKLVKEKKLVENLCDRELKNPEGAGFDLRVNAAYRIADGKAFLGETERSTPNEELLVKYNPDLKKQKALILSPGRFVLVETIEKVNLPADIVLIFRPRSTLYRCGVTLHTATASPGYSGKLVFGMSNQGPKPLKLEMGARIVNTLFLRVEGEVKSTYRGQWQGGRVSTKSKKEVQV